MKLNYREKVILAVVLVILIGVLGFFLLIKPKNEDIKTHTQTRDTTQATWDEIESRISKIPQLQEDIRTKRADSKTVTDQFVPVASIENERLLDQYMQKYANDCNVKISTLAASAPGDSSISYYYQSPKSATSAMVAADINGTMQAELAEKNKESNYVASRSTGAVLSSQYGITVTGTKENIWKYMKKIEDFDKTVTINSVSIADYEFKGGLTEEELAKLEEIKEKIANGEEPETPENDEDKIEGDSQVSFVLTLYSLYEMPEPNVE